MAVSSAKITLLSGKTPRNLVEKITKIFPKWVCLNELECWGYSPFLDKPKIYIYIYIYIYVCVYIYMYVYAYVDVDIEI